ncbi:hypothetical protein NDU88_001241 [Pleurodeles waltl]|uniref:Uncharacterized protein n=1 Tax=Pleurodeles waltl TaxID=8319 RepID=A0AAV7US81_PLEWA|nr:hypothetical protein NDU88_001241 [Pleurodeles waltl]
MRGNLTVRTLTYKSQWDVLNPDKLLHPCLAEWTPASKVVCYIAARLHMPLDKKVRSCLKAECTRPSFERIVALAPEVDAKMATFVAKFIKDLKKGISRSWLVCQDKLLDKAGPLAKILDMMEDAKVSGSLISPLRRFLAGFREPSYF